ncbi:MAG: hypothetical protein AB7I13_15065, partial [Vicinamibacterales bacterium]
RLQQTNYENPKGGEQQNAEGPESQLDKIRELAQRQDELNRRQEQLARKQTELPAEELRRQLETLSKDQNELRQQAENLARQMSGQKQPQGGSRSGQSSSGQGDQASSQQGQPQGGQQKAGGDRGQQMREVSEEMRNAASELRRDDPSQASARGGRALDKLRDLERALQAATPNEQRRALGDLQMEARQLADAQREVASELSTPRRGDAGRDAMRRLAGEQERLAERVQRLQRNLERQAGASAAAGRPSREATSAEVARAAGDASKDIQQQRLAERMTRSADQMRAAIEPGQASGGASAKGDGAAGQGAEAAPPPPPGLASEQDAIARTLDRLADRLAFVNGPQDDESKKLGDQMARARDLREQLDALGREVERLGQEASRRNQSSAASTPEGGQPGQSGESAQPSGSQGTSPGGELAKLQAEYERQLRETRELLEQLRRDDKTTGRSAGGMTFEGQGMVTSAPGTEAFKQDFAKWDDLRRQVTQALERAESDLSKRLQAKAAKDRLAAGIDDRPPAEYNDQVDRYFKAIAGRKAR